MASAQINPSLPTLGDPSKIPGLMEFWENELAELEAHERQIEACYAERGEREMKLLLRKVRREINRARKVLVVMETPTQDKSSRRQGSAARQKPSQGERYPHRHRRTRDRVGRKDKTDDGLRRRGERAARSARRDSLGKIYGALAYGS